MYFLAGGVDAEEDEKQDGKAPQWRAAVADEGQGDADDGTEAYDHADVDAEMEDEIRRHAVSVDASEDVGLSLGQRQHPHHEGDV